MKDPLTGKRVSHLNPEQEWIVAEVSGLRIVFDEVRQVVRERRANGEHR